MSKRMKRSEQGRDDGVRKRPKRRWKPTIRTFYQRLVAKGKTKMTALIAAMRKLLTILNLMIAKNESWNPNYA